MPISENFSFACGSPVFLSGCAMVASLRYAFLISLSLALFSSPSTS